MSFFDQQVSGGDFKKNVTSSIERMYVRASNPVLDMKSVLSLVNRVNRLKISNDMDANLKDAYIFIKVEVHLLMIFLSMRYQSVGPLLSILSDDFLVGLGYHPEDIRKSGFDWTELITKLFARYRDNPSYLLIDMNIATEDYDMSRNSNLVNFDILDNLKTLAAIYGLVDKNGEIDKVTMVAVYPYFFHDDSSVFKKAAVTFIETPRLQVDIDNALVALMKDVHNGYRNQLSQGNRDFGGGFI